jgi:ankyrin repeat protein
MDLVAKDIDGWMSPSWAAATGHDVVMALFLTQNTIDLDAKDWNRQTSLFLAVGNSHEIAVKLFLVENTIDLVAGNLAL